MEQQILYSLIKYWRPSKSFSSPKFLYSDINEAHRVAFIFNTQDKWSNPDYDWMVIEEQWSKNNSDFKIKYHM